MKKKTTPLPNIFYLFLVCIVGLAFLINFLIGSDAFRKTIDYLFAINNSKVEQKFYAEAKTIPDIRVVQFNTFEGMGGGTIAIKNKGETSIFYDLAGVTDILHIDTFDTEFMCPTKQTMIGYPLRLTKNSPFLKWFPFQVTTLRQLVDHYDEIVSILKTFPHTPNSNYTVQVSFWFGQRTTCSLYFKK